MGLRGILLSVALLSFAFLFGRGMGGFYFSASRSCGVSAVRPNQVSHVGGGLNLPGVDWKANGYTLVLVLQTGCHFCTESAPFYQRLKHQEKSGRLLAVFPQAVDESSRYLAKLGVTVDAVKQSPLGLLGVAGTPTLMLVDGAGVVRKEWLGKMRPDQESEVLSALRGGF